MSIFVARLILHLDIKSVCVRARARAWICAWEIKTKSPAHQIFSWHGGWFCFGPLKSPCIKIDRQIDRERDRQTEREREWANPRHHDAQVSASPAVMLHWLIYPERSSAAQDKSPAMDSLGGLLLRISVLLYGSFGVLALLPGITEPEFIRRCVQAHNTHRSRVTPPAAGARSMVRQVIGTQVFDALVMFRLD